MVDLSQVLADVASTLVGTSISTVPFITEAELYDYAEQSSIRLASQIPIHAQQSSVGISPMGATYTLLPRLVRLAHVDVAGKVLQQTPLAAIDALDPSWRTTAWIEQDRYILDSDGPSLMRLYPIPQAGSKDLRQVGQTIPAAISSAAPTTNVPSAMAEYYWWDALRQARGREGRAQAKDIDAMAMQMVNLFLASANDIWGD